MAAPRMLHRRFGRLIVIERAPNDKDGRRRYKCRCDCGSSLEVRGSYLRIGATRSCGCYQRERAELCQTERWARAKMLQTA